MIIFVGEKLRGGFVKEVADNPDISEEVRFIDPKFHITDVMDEIMVAARSGCSNIIYDVEAFTDDAAVLIEGIIKLKKTNGAEPILLVTTTHVNNEVVSEALDKGINKFINSGATMSDQKSELTRCLSGFYENNERDDITAIIKAKEERSVRTGVFKTIGIMGACHRVGTTTQAIQIVKFLQTKGYKACYVEMNSNLYPNMFLSRKESPEISYVLKTKNILDTDYEDEDLGFITVKGVDMYYKQDRLPDIYEKGYDYYVYDYGVYTDRDFNKASFLKDDINLIITAANVVELDYTLSILQNVSYEKAGFIFSFTAAGDRKEISDLMEEFKSGSRCYFADYTPNPYIIGDTSFYDEILSVEEKLETEPKAKKRFSLFKKSNK